SEPPSRRAERRTPQYQDELARDIEAYRQEYPQGLRITIANPGQLGNPAFWSNPSFWITYSQLFDSVLANTVNYNEYLSYNDYLVPVKNPQKRRKKWCVSPVAPSYKSSGCLRFICKPCQHLCKR